MSAIVDRVPTTERWLAHCAALRIQIAKLSGEAKERAEERLKVAERLHQESRDADEKP